jgi:ABC-type nitrate/sulfonate/bicarbonate transport system substrate-binding protein
MKPRMVKIAIFTGMVVGIVVGGYYIFVQQSIQNAGKPYSGPREKVTVSHTGNPDARLLLVAHELGYFDHEGIDVTFVEHTSGKESLGHVLEGTVDIGVSAEIPIVHTAFQEKDFYILARIASPYQAEGVVARKDHGIEQFADLSGKVVAVTVGTSAEFVLDSLLSLHNMSRDEVEIRDIKPNELATALFNGRVDAVSFWDPHIHRMQKELGHNSITFLGEGDVYTYKFYLLAGQEYTKENSGMLERFMRALVRAEAFIQNNQAEAYNLIARLTNTDVEFLKKFYAGTSIDPSLTQEMIYALEEQSRWAQRNSYTDATETPNFLDYIYFDALEAVRPDAVTIVR